MKHRLSFAVAWLRVLSKFLTKLLQRSIQAFERSMTVRLSSRRSPSSCHHPKSRFSLCSFFGFCGLGCQFKPDLGHDLGIKFLQGCGNCLWVIAIVQQDGDLWDSDRLGAKVIEVVAQHFDQTLLIGYIGFGAVGEKRKAQRINREMSFDAIGAFVKAEAFGLDTRKAILRLEYSTAICRVAGILHRLGIDHQQRCPLGFFLTCSRT